MASKKSESSGASGRKKISDAELKEMFWHPTRTEWQWACAAVPGWDPRHIGFDLTGKPVVIFQKDKPVETLEKGKKILEEQRAEAEAEKKRKEEAQKAEMERTEEEMFQSMLQREKLRERLVKQAEKQPERSREQSRKQALKRKAITTDDPFEASMLNAVDKDRKAANANYIVHAKRLSELPRISLSDPEEIRDRVNWYYQLCVTDGVRPNLPGLALAFGLTRTGLVNALGDRRMTRECAEEIGRGIAMLDEIMSGMALDGKVNPVAVIYFMNNWLGYKNASEVTTRTEVIESGVDQKALEQKYQSVVEMD